MAEFDKDIGNLALVQKHELDILKEVASLCDRFGLKYYLAEGTLLGAIRHRGFIPWDDDIDICMPREDYERFIEIASKKLSNHLILYYFKNGNKSEKYIRIFTQVRDHRIKVVRKSIGELEHNSYLSIDIFPIDGFPTSRLLQRLHQLHIFCSHELFRCSQIKYIDTKRKVAWWKRIGFLCAKLFQANKLNTLKLAEKCENTFTKYSFVSSLYTVNSYSLYRNKTIFPKSYYGEGRMVRFEDSYFRIPDESEKILEQEYGDYMTPPPIEERKPKHKIMLI